MSRRWIRLADPSRYDLVDWILQTKIQNLSSSTFDQPPKQIPRWDPQDYFVVAVGHDCPWTIDDLQSVVEWAQSDTYRAIDEGGDDVLNYSLEELLLAFMADDFLFGIDRLPENYYRRPEWNCRWWAKLGPIAEFVFERVKDSTVEPWFPETVKHMTLRDWAKEVSEIIVFDWYVEEGDVPEPNDMG